MPLPAGRRSVQEPGAACGCLGWLADRPSERQRPPKAPDWVGVKSRASLGAEPRPGGAGGGEVISPGRARLVDRPIQASGGGRGTTEQGVLRAPRDQVKGQ